MHKIIAIDQSTSSTKTMLFDEKCNLQKRVNTDHIQYYPQKGWVEHDAEEIFQNTIKGITQLIKDENLNNTYSLAITNQRETVVVWNRYTGKPVYHAVVWQCMRGSSICEDLKKKGYSNMVQSKCGLLIDPYFSASGTKWILDNVPGARIQAENGDLMMGTMDSWLIWKLTEGHVHATDYTNASRTLLFNIKTLDWDDELLGIFTIPRNMMPKTMPCDSIFGETTVKGLFKSPIQIAGVLGDSHGALTGQMCFKTGMGKATYGTGSSVMFNIGNNMTMPPQGLVTTIGFSALGKIFYAYEGNIHCTGATIKWLIEQLGILTSPKEAEAIATSIPDNDGVYFVPAFAGLGAPWWKSDVKAMIWGLTLGSSKVHIIRAALESIAYQVKDLIDMMTKHSGAILHELRVDGGPTKNKFLMQFQADMLHTTISPSNVEEASALGAVIMNGFARKIWTSFDEVIALRTSDNIITPQMPRQEIDHLYAGWSNAVKKLTE
jgi:glycerol kinase